MEKKDVLLELLDFVMGVADELDKELTSEEKVAPGTWDIWSAKDGIAHIAHWLDKDLDRIEARGVLPVVDEHGIEEINKSVYDTWADKSWDEVDLFFRNTFTRAINLVQNMDGISLLGNLEREDGAKRPIWELIAGHGVLHTKSHIGLIYRRRGNAEAATALEEKAAGLLRKLDDQPKWRGTIDYNLACSYALAGDKSRALALLKEALSLNPKLTDLSKRDPDFDGIRGDPAFSAIVEPNRM